MLTTVDSLIEALGGTSEAAKLTGVGASAVSNWKKRGAIPSEKFLVISDRLKRSRQAVDPALFGFNKAEASA